MRFKEAVKSLPVFDARYSSELRFFQWCSLLIFPAALFLPFDRMDLSVCFFYNMTGIPCPGCGLTRSFSSLVHLHFLESLMYNPFGPAVVAAAASFVISAFYRPAAEFYDRNRRAFSIFIFVAAVLLIIFGIFRGVLIVYWPDAANGLFILRRGHPVFQFLFQ